MYGQLHMYISWSWLTVKGNCMSETRWYILGLPPIRSEVLGSTLAKLTRRSWLCFALGLIFFWQMAWFLQFGSLPRSGISRLLVTEMWVLMHLKQLSGLLNLWLEQWCLQDYEMKFRMYCLRFLLDFLYWSLTSLCLDVVPKTAPKFSTHPLSVCWAVEAPASSAKSLVTDSYGTTYLAASLFLVAWIWFARLRGTGNYCVTAVPAIASRGRVGHFYYRSHCIFFTLLFLNTVKLKLLSSFRVGHNPTRL